MRKILDVIISDIRDMEKVVTDIRDHDNISPIEIELAALKASSLHQELLLLARNLKSNSIELPLKDELTAQDETVVSSSFLDELNNEFPAEPEVEKTEVESSLEEQEENVTEEALSEDVISSKETAESAIDNLLSAETEEIAIPIVDNIESDNSYQVELDDVNPEKSDEVEQEIDTATFIDDQSLVVDEISGEESEEKTTDEDSIHETAFSIDDLESNEEVALDYEKLSAVEAALKSLKKDVGDSGTFSYEELQKSKVEEISTEDHPAEEVSAETDGEISEEPANFIPIESEDIQSRDVVQEEDLAEDHSKSLIDDLFDEESETTVSNDDYISKQEPITNNIEAEATDEFPLEEGDVDFPMKEIEPEVVEPQEEVPHILQEDAIDEKPEVSKEKETVKGKKVKSKEPVATVLGEKFVSKVKSINDIFSSKVKEEEHPFEHMPVNSLKMSININDRFLFIKDLFEGNQVQYTEAVEKIDSCDNIREAVGYLKSNFRWHQGEASQKFLELVKQRFE